MRKCIEYRCHNYLFWIGEEVDHKLDIHCRDRSRIVHLVLSPISNIFPPFSFSFPVNGQDLVGPLAPSAPYTPLQAVPPPGMAGLHSPPLTSSPRHHQGSPRQGLHGVGRGLVSGGAGETSSPARRLREFDVRAEMEKHKLNLSIDDWAPGEQQQNSSFL